MDRNVARACAPSANGVALRKESVDRNIECLQKEPYNMKSLSARRAWIEISVNSHTSFLPRVALRKESVDRNTVYGIVITFENWSLSARRAWIEILR